MDACDTVAVTDSRAVTAKDIPHGSFSNAWIVCDAGENKRVLAGQAGALCALWLHHAPETGFPDTILAHGSGTFLALFFFASFLRIMDAQQMRGDHPHAHTTFCVWQLGRVCTAEQKRTHLTLFLHMVSAWVTGPERNLTMMIARLRNPLRWLSTDWTPEYCTWWETYTFLHVLRECKWTRFVDDVGDMAASFSAHAAGVSTHGLYLCDGWDHMEPLTGGGPRRPSNDIWAMHVGAREPSSFRYVSTPDFFASMYDWTVHRMHAPSAVSQFRAVHRRILDLCWHLLGLLYGMIMWFIVSAPRQTHSSTDEASSMFRVHRDPPVHWTDVAVESALRRRSTRVHWTILDTAVGSHAVPLVSSVTPDFSPLRPVFTKSVWHANELPASSARRSPTPPPVSQPLTHIEFQQCVHHGMRLLWTSHNVSESARHPLPW
jgi:hypothetical protein